MCKCVRCGAIFDIGRARHLIGVNYGAGTYNDYYPNYDVCEDCALSEISADYGTGEEIMELMGDSWDD